MSTLNCRPPCFFLATGKAELMSLKDSVPPQRRQRRQTSRHCVEEKLPAKRFAGEELETHTGARQKSRAFKLKR